MPESEQTSKTALFAQEYSSEALGVGASTDVRRLGEIFFHLATTAGAGPSARRPPSELFVPRYGRRETVPFSGIATRVEQRWLCSLVLERLSHYGASFGEARSLDVDYLHRRPFERVTPTSEPHPLALPQPLARVAIETRLLQCLREDPHQSIKLLSKLGLMAFGLSLFVYFGGNILIVNPIVSCFGFLACGLFWLMAAVDERRLRAASK